MAQLYDCLVVNLTKFVVTEGKDCPSEANEIIDVCGILRVTSMLNRDTMITKELWMLE